MDFLITLGLTIAIIIGIILFLCLITLIIHLDDKYGFVIPVIFLIGIFLATFYATYSGLVETKTIEPFLPYINTNHTYTYQCKLCNETVKQTEEPKIKLCEECIATIKEIESEED